jgi:hypothetical protein
MADSSSAVQTAVIARLRGDATLQALMTGASSPEWNIFDEGGSGAEIPSFPAVFVHPLTMSLGTALAMGQDATDVFVQVSTFTQSEGFSLARPIAGRIYALLHGPIATPLALSGGFGTAQVLFDGRQELTETTDALTQHVVDRYHCCISG